MSGRASTVYDLEVASVSYAPLPEGPAAQEPASVPFAVPAVVDQIVERLHQPLAKLVQRIRHIGPAGGGAMVLVTGCQRGMGSSTLALALARVAAEQKRVLLIDADMEDPETSRRLSPQPECGWEEALHGLCSFERPLRFLDAKRRLGFLPLKQPVANPAALLVKPALRVWLPQLRQEYNFIVVDGGSVFDTGNKLASWVDAALLVCDARTTGKNDRAAAWDALEEGGAHVLGIVETFASDGK